VAGLKCVEHWLPGAPGESEPVHQYERRPGAAAVARERWRACRGGAPSNYRQDFAFAAVVIVFLFVEIVLAR
jgi:hypothetical protein